MIGLLQLAVMTSSCCALRAATKRSDCRIIPADIYLRAMLNLTCFYHHRSRKTALAHSLNRHRIFSKSILTNALIDKDQQQPLTALLYCAAERMKLTTKETLRSIHASRYQGKVLLSKSKTIINRNYAGERNSRKHLPMSKPVAV